MREGGKIDPPPPPPLPRLELICRYKGNTSDVKFDNFNNVLNIINKVKNGEISLADVKNNPEKFK